MSLFKDMLGADETLFKNPIALDYDYQPKLVPYRVLEQRTIVNCIKPLFQQRNGKNALVYGAPGVGKTVATKHIIRELEEETDEIIPVYINCWQKNTSYKIILELCEAIGYRFIQNKNTEELFRIVKNVLNKKAAVIVLDEIDKLDSLDILYNLLEDLYRKTIVLITNYKEWALNLDDRIKSRLTPEMIEFKAYNLFETRGILKERIKFAFIDGVWSDEAFNLVAKKTFELGDIRIGLHLLREAGQTAENASSRKVGVEHVSIAIKKIDEFSIKKSSELEDETKFILAIVKKNSGERIGELFKIYQKEGGKGVYKTFQRKIGKLAEGKFVSLQRIEGGAEGNTTLVKYSSNRSLKDF